jgi:cytochrome oxidase Cu insertion factor (SCO1/SenC/PrrC family)
MTRCTLRIARTAFAVAVLALCAGGPARAATDLPQAPDFTLTLLDGRALSLADLKGKPVVINFWRSG